MPLSQCCRIIKHSGQGLGDVLQGYGWCRSCSRGLLVYLTNPISCSGAQVEPVPERFHLCGARCCWIFILRVWEICCSSMPDLYWDAESPTGSSPEGSSAAAAVRLQSLVNAPRVGGTWWAAPLAHASGMARSLPWARNIQAVLQKFWIFYCWVINPFLVWETNFSGPF